jgi:hypothetical protein
MCREYGTIGHVSFRSSLIASITSYIFVDTRLNITCSRYSDEELECLASISKEVYEDDIVSKDFCMRNQKRTDRLHKGKNKSKPSSLISNLVRKL